MAKVTHVVTTDDITGETLTDEDATTIDLTLNGVTYQADLGPDSLKEFEETLEPYLSVFTRVGGRKKSRRGGSTTPSGVDNATVRAWAAENGHEVSDRGRLPKKVIDAYLAAN